MNNEYLDALLSSDSPDDEFGYGNNFIIVMCCVIILFCLCLLLIRLKTSVLYFMGIKQKQKKNKIIKQEPDATKDNKTIKHEPDPKDEIDSKDNKMIKQELDSEDLDFKISQPKRYKNYEVILYHASWCGYSREFRPTWDKFVEYAKRNLQVVKTKDIICESDNEKICESRHIRGYPTIILYTLKKNYVYNGDRNLGELIKFVEKHIL